MTPNTMTPKGHLAVSKIAIIGCSGFIGSHLLEAFLLYPGLKLVGWNPVDTKIKQHLDRPEFSYRRIGLRGTKVWNELGVSSHSVME